MFSLDEGNCWNTLLLETALDVQNIRFAGSLPAKTPSVYLALHIIVMAFVLSVCLSVFCLPAPDILAV